MRTNVYIDGFNLYYRALKGTPYKWLDLAKLSEVLVSNQYQIGQIRYFTARVSARSNNLGSQQRQDVYLRALETIPNLEIHYGNFLSKPKSLPVVSTLTQPRVRFEEVMVTEEKGSDVNLATYLLLDAFNNDYDAAIVMSNDSDLIEPIRVVMDKFGKHIIVVITDPKARGSALPATSYRRIRTGNLVVSQFPATLTDGRGTIHKPSKW